MSRPRLGASPLPDGRCSFRVWAPATDRVELVLYGATRSVTAMTKGADGYHDTTVAGAPPRTRYAFRLDGGPELPDPASRAQPEGVHGPSAVGDPAPHRWTDTAWNVPPLRDLVIYELHVGTFTTAGTFDAIVPHLGALRDLGVTAIELMPFAQFPGSRNWGYDGVFPHAVHHGYGGAEGLSRLVDACHAHGLAVIADVVYNHLGPEGNIFSAFGPYFTDRYRTPWGQALNFDGPGSDEVRHHFIEAARALVRDHHVDGLRLDAVQEIHDRSARHFLTELAESVRAEAPRTLLIGESDLNDPRFVRPPEVGGLGLDAQWVDDYHHALHVALTGEQHGYYQDYRGAPDVARALREVFVYAGRHSRFRGHRLGAPIAGDAAERFVVFAQNHDQTGNRMFGERLAFLLPFAALRAAAAAVILSPYTPLLFMGEEYGERAPFQYFTDHSRRDIIEGVRKGRRAEFAAFFSQGEPPDAQDPETLRRSTLDHELVTAPGHRELRAFYRELLRVRRDVAALRERLPADSAEVAGDVLVVQRGAGPDRICQIHSFARETAEATMPRGSWRVLLDGGEARWGAGGGEPAQIEGTRVTLPPYAVLLLGAGDTR